MYMYICHCSGSQHGLVETPWNILLGIAAAPPKNEPSPPFSAIDMNRHGPNWGGAYFRVCTMRLESAPPDHL